MTEAALTGRPMLRAMSLYYSYDANMWNEEVNNRQYMFGAEMLVAPCLEQGSNYTFVWIPAHSGTWVHLVRLLLYKMF
jgi:alpha-glucosidase (family GH31 glycosyl hydrolase)